MKDLFSATAADYSRFRPNYPTAVFSFIDEHLRGFEAAWDCATGNGQIAVQLKDKFQQVFATDISATQLAAAPQFPNIFYKQEAAEATDFLPNQFDLITVGQAIHWFNFEHFYAEVNRVAKDEALIAVLGYGLPKINPAIDNLIQHFHTPILGQYWEKERAYIDALYTTLPFPFTPIKTPEFQHIVHWNIEHLMGYLSTWSAIQKYKKMTSINPLIDLEKDLKKYWGAAVSLPVCFTILCKIAYIKK